MNGDRVVGGPRRKPREPAAARLDNLNDERRDFSQWSILYSDKQCRAGGWPMETPNPNARNMDTAWLLVATSYSFVGLDKPS